MVGLPLQQVSAMASMELLIVKYSLLNRIKNLKSVAGTSLEYRNKSFTKLISSKTSSKFHLSGTNPYGSIIARGWCKPIKPLLQ